MTWPVYEAKSRFSELLDAAVELGPQIISRRGVETAVVLPIGTWKRLQQAARQLAIDPLTDPSGPHDLYIPSRQNFTIRPVKFED